MVFLYDNQLLNEKTGSIDMGTYNYLPSGISKEGHVVYDVEPYNKWTNTLNDLIKHQSEMNEYIRKEFEALNEEFQG